MEEVSIKKFKIQRLEKMRMDQSTLPVIVFIAERSSSVNGLINIIGV